MIGVGIAVLQHVDIRLAGKPACQGRRGPGRHDCQSERCCEVACDREQAIERLARIHGIVVAPPELGGATRLSPARRLVGKRLPTTHGDTI